MIKGEGMVRSLNARSNDCEHFRVLMARNLAAIPDTVAVRMAVM